MESRTSRKFFAVFTLVLLGSIVLCAFSFQPVESLEPPPTEWSRTFGGTSDDSAEWVVQTKDGGYAIAGNTYSYGAGGVDAWLVKTDPAGQKQWDKAYGGTGGDYIKSVVQTSDRGYALAGITNSFGAGQEDFWLVKTGSSGEMLWSKAFGGAGTDWAYSVVQTSDDGYVIAGVTNSSGAGSYDAWLVKVDSAGNMQWNRTYGGANYEEARSLVRTSDGGYAFAGSTSSYGAGDHDFWLVKTDSNGNMQWNKTYGTPSTEAPFSVVQTKDGGYALAGIAVTSSAGILPNDDFWLVKTDLNGNMQWSQAYGGTGNDGESSLIQTDDGGYALVGYTYSYGAGQPSSYGTGETNFWLVKTNSSGYMQWSKAYGGDYGEAASSVIQTVDEGYAIAGDARSESFGKSDFWLVKIANEDTRGDNSLLTAYIGLAIAVAGVGTVAIIIYFKRVKR